MKKFRYLQLMPVIFLLTIFSQHAISQTLFGQIIKFTEQENLSENKISHFTEKSFHLQTALRESLLLQGQEWHATQIRQLPAEQKISSQAADQQSVNPTRHITIPATSKSLLTAQEKISYGFKHTFLKPSAYINTALSASFTQWTEKEQPQKDTEDLVADGLSRFAIKFATDSTKRMLVSGIYPVLFHQDPRYQPSGQKRLQSRIWYAASRVFVTENDFGHLRPNYAQLGGTLTASALANIWERNSLDRNRIGVGPTFSRFIRSTSFDVLTFIVLREFGPDIKRKLLRK